MIHKLIVGAPFGNYLGWPGVTSTVGTYTAAHRAGAFKRLWRILATLRYNRKAQAWTNKLGLPNPGIDHLTSSIGFSSGRHLDYLRDRILSIHGFCAGDWAVLASKVVDLLSPPAAVEFNLSCPNVEHNAQMLADVTPAIHHLLARGIDVIVKLPPLRWRDLAIPLYASGVRAFHCCNTISTPGGGMSGKPLKNYSLWAVRDLRELWGRKLCLIGGGGVTGLQDAKDFVEAGADHVAVASMLLNPLAWRLVTQIRDWLNGNAGPAPATGPTPEQLADAVLVEMESRMRAMGVITTAHYDAGRELIADAIRSGVLRDAIVERTANR